MKSKETSDLADVLIIGAGISGLAARHRLLQAGLKVITAEKSRGAGGRMSTRRREGVVADLGAQFTSAKNPTWKRFLNPAEVKEVKELNLPGDPSHPKYIHEAGMSRMARLLIAPESLSTNPIHFQNRILRLTSTQDQQWEALTDQQKKLQAKAILLTAPLPQALELLDQSTIALPSELEPDLRGVGYQACLTLLVRFSSPCSLPAPGIIKNPNPKLAGIYDQGTKGIKTEVSNWVIHASPEFSKDHWTVSDPEIAEKLWEEARSCLKDLTFPEVVHFDFHRWRYSEPEKTLKETFIPLGTQAPLAALAGDSFGRSSVDGAFQSGIDAADFLISNLMK